MKVFNVIRTTLLVAAVLGACAVDAKKIKLCDADGHAAPAPTPAKTGGVQQTPAPAPAPAAKPAVVPAVTPATAAADADIGAGKVIPGGPSAAPAAPVAPAGPSGPAPAPAGPAATPAATPAPAPAPAPAGGAATNAGTVKASFSYKGSNAGGPGTYQMVTDFATCSKAPQSMYSPVSPLDDDLTFVFRGPLTIHNIAIFDGAGGNWNRVSSYAKGGASENLVFLNNRNIDYSGKTAPQGFATADGRGNAQTKQAFAGELGAATSPNGFSVYADEKTGAEVNIFQDKKCGEGVECKGYYDKDGTAYLGWGGAKKIFITKVHMPHSGAPDMPAVWALNGQVVRSSQYGCNCRGVGTRGGCGELDIAEVIPGNSNMLATHYYKYESSTGHDTWCKRPVDAPATYITIIDEAHGVKVLEVDDFDFGAASISADVVAKWQSA